MTMIQEYDWYEPINIIYKKIHSYMLSHFNAKVQCDAAVIRELCESRDSCSDLLFSRKELEVFIEMLHSVPRSRFYGKNIELRNLKQ